MKVTKFGGSSLAGAEQFRRVKEIIRSDPDRTCVVVSAAGKRSSNDNKITDLLYLTRAHLRYGVSYEDIFSMIEERYYGIREELGLSFDLESEFAKIRLRLDRDIPVDYLVSRGEYLTARLMSEYLGYPFLDAADCIFFGYDGELDREKTCAAIAEHALKNPCFVLPGFYGVLPNGQIRVMSRGGSDIIGAIAAAALNAEIYENWTDVSGILMADPKIVTDPRPIPYMTYDELRELSCMGASVLHEESILPVREKNIPLNIRNTNRPGEPGTMILEVIPEDAPRAALLTGIAGKKNYTQLTVFKKQITTDTRILRRTLELLESWRVEVENVALGVDSFRLILPTAQAQDRIYDLIAQVRAEFKPVEIDLQDGIALVASVGRSMVSVPGSSARLFGALGKNDINIRVIAQGADEISIIVGVDNRDFEKTIRVLYEGFMKQEGSGAL